MTITEKQMRFIEEYVIDYNATQAAIRAGYSEKGAANSGYRNVKDDEIFKAIKQKQEDMRTQLQQQFSSDAVIARKIMYNIMKDEDSPPVVRLSAAKDFMDRAGFKPVDKQETTLNGGLDINKQSELIGKYLHE